MALEIGAVLEGKVTGITKYGAFVGLPEGKSGLVHISEISNSYVSDINGYLQVGQTVQVRVMNISEDGKINLSIKRAAEDSAAGNRYKSTPRPAGIQTAEAPKTANTVSGHTDNSEFEDRLKKFMQESDSRIADNRMYSEHKQRGRRR